MRHRTKLSFLLLGLVAGLAQRATAATHKDHIELLDDQLELVELTTVAKSLFTFNADFGNVAQPGQANNCGTAVTLTFAVIGAGVLPKFINHNGQPVDTIVSDVGGDVPVVITSTTAAPVATSIRVMGRFNNLQLSTSSATLHITVRPPAFLAGPGATRVLRGATTTVAFAAQHSAAGGSTTVGFDGEPAGLTLTASPATIPVGVAQASVAVAAAPALAAGSYSVDVIAAVPGFVDQVEPLAVEVADPIHLELVRDPRDIFGIKIGSLPEAIQVTAAREPGVTAAITYSVSGGAPGLGVATHPGHAGSSVVLVVTRGPTSAPGRVTITLNGVIGNVTTSLRIPLELL
jgi:hypothetical protein